MKFHSRRTAIIVLHAAIAVAGVVTVILGPLLPFLIARWSLSDERAGLLFLFQFGGNLAGILSLGALLSRRGYSTVFLLGFICIALGVAGLDARTAIVGCIATFLFGYGLGLVLAATNLCVAEMEKSRRASALSLLNLAWGIGAISCPLLIFLAQRARRLSALPLVIAALALVAGLTFAALSAELPKEELTVTSPQEHADTVSLRTAMILGSLFLVYVGTENSVSGWAAALAKRVAPQAASAWELAPMCFWGGLLAGRSAAPAAFRRVGERALMVTGLGFSAMCIVALAFVTSLHIAELCLCGAGLGFAYIYPLLIAWMVENYGDQARRAGNVPFALASIGGATLPWLVGFVSTKTASLRAAMAVPAAGCLVMIGLLSLLRSPEISRDSRIP